MMRKAVLPAVVIFIFFWTGTCLALEWQKLHERVDNLTLEEAVAAARANPGSIDDSYVLALAYLRQHKDDKAKAEFDRILKRDFSIDEARWGLAEIMRRRHKLSEAEKLLEDIITARPEFSPAYISLAYIKFIRLDFDRAVQLSKIVMHQGASGKTDPADYARGYTMFAGAKGIIAHNAGPLSKLINGTVVLPALKRAQQIKPDSAQVLYGLGAFYLLAPGLSGGDLIESEGHLKKAIEKDPSFPDVYVRLAQVYKLKGDEVEYEVCMKKALELDPQNELALDIKSGSCKFICVEK
jgi:Tfp pilus assembly protein PilF